MQRLLVLIVVPALLACALLESPAPLPPTATAAATTPSSPAGGLTNDDSTFSYDSLIGKPASAFTAPDANAQPYTFTPNDGRKHVIVFNMGFA